MNKVIRRYAFFLGAVVLTIILTFYNKDIGTSTFRVAGSSFRQMISVLPPIMILLGLMDVWVPREVMAQYMGEDSGAKGIFFAILMGSIAAGPMYAAFPFTTVLLRKGVRFSNVIIFMNAWCVTKIPTLLFEITSLGYRFTFLRFAVNLPGIILMGYLVQWMLREDELRKIYRGAEEMGN